jgi:hypothetical protein
MGSCWSGIQGRLTSRRTLLDDADDPYDPTEFIDEDDEFD